MYPLLEKEIYEFLLFMLFVMELSSTNNSSNGKELSLFIYLSKQTIHIN